MALESGVGVSTHEQLVEAATEAARAAQAQCRNAKLVLLFVTHNHPAAELVAASRAVRALFPGAKVAGGQVNGVTFGEARYDALYANKRAVAVMALGGAELACAAAIVPAVNGDAIAAGRELAAAVRPMFGSAPAGGILLTPGMSAGFNMVDQGILDGIRSVEPRLRVTGCGLCGGMNPEGAFKPGSAVLDDRVESMGTLLVAFGSDTTLGFATANGMQAVGRGGFITEVEGPFIKTIDGRKASDAVLDLLVGDNAEEREQFARNPAIASIERGITLAAPDPEGDFYWCHMPVMFTPDGAVADFFHPRRGGALSVCKIDPQSCMGAVEQATKMLVEDAGSHEFEAVLAFSCALRGFTLGPEVAHEDQELRKHVRSRSQLGIIANGEIGSYRHGRSLSTGWVYALFGLVEARS